MVMENHYRVMLHTIYNQFIFFSPQDAFWNVYKGQHGKETDFLKFCVDR